MKAFLDKVSASSFSEVVRPALESFAYSFTVSLVLSKGNIFSGLTGGALGVCAVVIRVFCLMIVNKGNEYFGSDWPKSFDRGLAFVSAIVIISSFSGIKPKTSLFFSTLPFLLVQNNAEEIAFPLMCIVV